MSDVTKLTLVHLANSCSQSVLWLLEELGVDYDVRKHDRPSGQAPPDLRRTHPQGKSPQLLLPGGRVITQLSAILLYLIRTYDGAEPGSRPRFHRPPRSGDGNDKDRDDGEDEGGDDPVREEQLVCIGVSDLSSKLGAKFMFDGLTAMSPFFVRPLLARVRDTINRLALDPDVEAALGALEAEIAGRSWFMGGEGPSRADFALHFSVGLAAQPRYADLDDYPGLKAWMRRCEEREAWKRSLEVGNGYDLDFPSKW